VNNTWHGPSAELVLAMVCSISGVCRWSSRPYASRFSSALQNNEPCFRPRPAPLIPVLESTMIPVRWIAPAAISGSSASDAAVT
jgi:hypothetical protein